MSAWEELVTTALLGTDRRALPVSLPEAVGRLAAAQPDGALALLDAAAGYTSYRQAGARPAPAAAPEPPPRQVTDLAPEPAQALLDRLLRARELALVDEWLGICTSRGLGVRAGLWVALLSSAASPGGPDRVLVRAALGQRGRAFLQLNPAWRSVARAAATRDGRHARWSTATTVQTLSAVRVTRSPLGGRRVRVEPPAGGPGLRELLAGTDLEALHAHTGLDPEPLLALLQGAADRPDDVTAGLAAAAVAQRHPGWATALARVGLVTSELAPLVPAEAALALLGSRGLDAAASRRLALAVSHHAPLSVLGDLVRLAGQPRPPGAPADGLEEAARLMAVRVEIQHSFDTPTPPQEKL